LALQFNLVPDLTYVGMNTMWASKSYTTTFDCDHFVNKSKNAKKLDGADLFIQSCPLLERTRLPQGCFVGNFAIVQPAPYATNLLIGVGTSAPGVQHGSFRRGMEAETDPARTIVGKPAILLGSGRNRNEQEIRKIPQEWSAPNEIDGGSVKVSGVEPVHSKSGGILSVPGTSDVYVNGTNASGNNADAKYNNNYVPPCDLLESAVRPSLAHYMGCALLKDVLTPFLSAIPFFLAPCVLAVTYSVVTMDRNNMGDSPSNSAVSSVLQQRFSFFLLLYGSVQICVWLFLPALFLLIQRVVIGSDGPKGVHPMFSLSVWFAWTVGSCVDLWMELGPERFLSGTLYYN